MRVRNRVRVRDRVGRTLTLFCGSSASICSIRSRCAVHDCRDDSRFWAVASSSAIPVGGTPAECTSTPVLPRCCLRGCPLSPASPPAAAGAAAPALGAASPLVASAAAALCTRGDGARESGERGNPPHPRPRPGPRPPLPPEISGYPDTGARQLFYLSEGSGLRALMGGGVGCARGVRRQANARAGGRAPHPRVLHVEHIVTLATLH